MEKITLTRKELYDLVWTESLPSLSKKYNVSYDDLRKLCIKMNIPLPKSGHWAKFHAGKEVFKEDLPDNYNGKKEITFPLEAEEKQMLEILQSPLVILQKEIERDNKSLLKVPSKLSDPDKLIIAAKNRLTGQKPNSYKYSRDFGLVYCSRNELDIAVSPDNVERALLFMDSLIKLLRARGCDMKVEHDSYRSYRDGTYIVTAEKEIKVGLREKIKKVVADIGGQRAEYHTTGILYFKMDTYPEGMWQDGKLRIEDRLSRIIAKAEMYSNEWKESRLRDKKQQEERQEKMRIQHENEQKQKKELSDFKKMLHNAGRWQKSIMLRNYIDELESKAILNNSLSEELKNWILWARKKVDWYDPFIESDDELLGDSDRDSITEEKG